MKENLLKIASGAAGGNFNSSPGLLPSILKEIQGLSFSLITAAGTAGDKLAIAAIRPEDTIVFALNNAAGVFSDVTSSLTISAVGASGTITLASVVAGDEVTVNGKTYVFQLAASVKYGQVTVGLTDTASAANLAAAINAYEAVIGGGGGEVQATSDAAVVTVNSLLPETLGNAIAMTTPDTTITLSGATLTGGTATGGVVSSVNTNELLVVWYNKK